MKKSVKKVEVEGKRILVRLDLNSTVEDGEIQVTPRMKAHSETLEYLSDEGGKIVVLAHQGRPKRDDFLHLKQHSKLLEKLLGRKVKFVESVCGKKAKNKIRDLENKEILLLDNVRMHEDELKDVSPEEHGKSELVSELSGLSDIYVNDAFSVCHRNQASITGFPQVMKSYLGLQLKRELEGLKNLENPTEPVYFILGGNKPKDAVNVMEIMFDDGKMDMALLGGSIGEIFMQSIGIDLGAKSYEPKDIKDDIDQLIEFYGDKIIVPRDVAYLSDGERKEIPIEELPAKHKIFDIGSETVKEFKEEIEKAETVILNGPLGKFEENKFQKGTKEIFKFLKKADISTFLGGGETSNAVDELGFDLKKDFSHVSLAGGAFISYLSGKDMPGLEALED